MPKTKQNYPLQDQALSTGRPLPRAQDARHCRCMINRRDLAVVLLLPPRSREHASPNFGGQNSDRQSSTDNGRSPPRKTATASSIKSRAETPSVRRPSGQSWRSSSSSSSSSSSWMEQLCPQFHPSSPDSRMTDTRRQ